jgi:16S rRNA G966 N2-methylase RsmD
MKDVAKHYKADESIQIVNDDFYPWCTENLQNDSVDLILTDPPYPKEYLHVWGQLGEVAARILKTTGYLVAYSGQLYFNQAMRALDEHLHRGNKAVWPHPGTGT